MAKVMVFIDGSWLYANMPRLGDSYVKRGFQIDFGKLPSVIAAALQDQLGNSQIDLVRTYLFGSYASNADPADDAAVQRHLDFYAMLREEHRYEVEIFPINFRGRRLRKADRDPSDTFEAKEKCVDISLASSMLYFAAVPFAYDIAIAIVGDQDFKPALQHVRRLGKRVAIASIKGSCSEELADPTDQMRVRDFDLIWMDDLLQKLELRRDPHQLECDSSTHEGPRKVWTIYYPRRGHRFYCEECKAQFKRQRQEIERPLADGPSPESVSAESEATEAINQIVRGHVSAIRDGANGPFAFMRTVLGNQYYFNLTSFEGQFPWDTLEEGMPLQAEIIRLPTGGKAGAVRRVRSCIDADPGEVPPTNASAFAASNGSIGLACD